MINIVAPMLEDSSPLQGTLLGFSRLRHLRLLMDPRGCWLDTPSQLNTSMAEIGNNSQLESLYIGFMHGFGCSICGMRGDDAEDSVNLCLSSMQHLKSVHLDSFWPALLELPPGASLHATFRSAPGQKHSGLWAGKAADVHNPRLPFRSMHFLSGPGLGPEHAITAKELWPLRVGRKLELIRVRAGSLHLKAFEFPGLMQAERVLITASECHLRFLNDQVPHTQLKLRFSERLRMVISRADISAARVACLKLCCNDAMGSRPLSVLFLRGAMLAAGNELSVTSRHTMCQSKGRKKLWSYGWGTASLDVGCETMDAREWGHAVKCCCHACLACLHRDGAAAFAEAIAEESALFEA